MKLHRVLVPSLDNKSMRIPTHIRVHEKDVQVNALVDSGAEGTFISQYLIDKFSIPSYPLEKPIMAQNVDGTPVKGADITRFTILPIRVGTTSIPTNFLIIGGIANEQIILGHPWLKQNNPQIDWQNNNILVNKVRVQAVQLPIEGEDYPPGLGIDPLTVKTIRLRSLEISHPEKPKEEPPDNLPPEYHKYAPIFQKKASERFPPPRPYDHAIELKPEFVPSDCPVYSLTPLERQKHDEFIEENLRKGYIRPSKSPQASPFFFVPKKDPQDL